MRIHPVFHVDLLTAEVIDTIPGRVPPVNPPEIVDGIEKWDIEKVLNSRWVRNQLQYLVKWLDYDEGYNTWEPVETLEEDVPYLLRDFHTRNPAAFSRTHKPPPRRCH